MSRQPQSRRDCLELYAGKRHKSTEGKVILKRRVRREEKKRKGGIFET